MYARRSAHRPLLFIMLAVSAAVAFILALGVGAVALSPLQTLKGLFSLAWGDGTDVPAVIVGLRLARAILAASVGAALAAAGAVLQGLFRNPLADPYVIGSSSGSALGVVLAITTGLSASWMGFSPIGGAAFLGGLGATFLVYLVAGSGRVKSDSASLLLAGSAMGSLISACVSILLVLKDKHMHQAWFWLLGGFSGRGIAQLRAAAPALIIGFIAAVASSRVLDLLSSGDEEAKSLGLSPHKVRLVVGAFAALLVSGAVSIAGAIGFVGLVCPHLARRMIGPNHRYLIPASALLGATMLLLSDTAARSLFAPLEMPVGAVTALIGAPFFLYKIARRGSEAIR